MKTKVRRDTRKEAVLSMFDADKGWKGVVWYARAFSCSRQYISKLLLAERAAEYRRKRHPTRGRRTDLHG